MVFSLRLPKEADLRRIGIDDGPQAKEEPRVKTRAERLAFWRGAILGFLGALLVIDAAAFGGQMTLRAVWTVRYAAWTLMHPW
jgi:hypothetical protein